MPYATGVGSRKIPVWAYQAMRGIATVMKQRGYMWRTGDAPGADEAIRLGSQGEVEVWRARNRPTNEPCKTVRVMSNSMYVVSGNWLVRNHLMSYFWNIEDWFTKYAHARNVYQVIGWPTGAARMETAFHQTFELSEFLLYWAPVDKQGRVKGGTRTAVGTAKVMGVPTYNLNDPEQTRAFLEYYDIPHDYTAFDDKLRIAA